MNNRHIISQQTKCKLSSLDCESLRKNKRGVAAFMLSIAAFTLPQKLARLNRAGLGPDLAHFSGTVYIATKTSSVDPSPVRGARLYVLSFYSFLVE